jgi:hypothetical protein
MKFWVKYGKEGRGGDGSGAGGRGAVGLVTVDDCIVKSGGVGGFVWGCV